ncbi:hypothetical protein [uncultured Methanobrevibacter sp.]|uniref:hypothetical protein n=1 Tax=uncultured Methanobrevibacter sp. TaxID=253161 RepID=UPI0025DECC5F|nr:hypothetical protein [uncultured Methanobrevibacter sp.]
MNGMFALKKSVMFILMLLILIIIPISYANDNVTSDDSPVDIENEEILIQNAVYFNSSVENDGIGTQENPYKYLSCDKIVNDSIIYMADGEYTIEKSISVNNLTIIGQSSSKTIINGNSFKLYSDGDLSITSLTLNNFTVENSKNLKVLDVNFKNNNINGSGGAININSDSAYVLLNNVTFRNNYATQGGAIYINSRTSKVEITNSKFINNTALNSGGAICIESALSVNIFNSSFVNNTALRGFGGAIFSNQSNINIRNSNFTSSKAYMGGAIYDNNSKLSITSIIANNNTAEYYGGAIYKQEGSSTINSSSFNDNNALNGGAIFAVNATSFNVISSNFTSNKAVYGEGAIFTISNKKEVFKDNIYQNNIVEINYPKSIEYTIYLGNNNRLLFDKFELSNCPIEKFSFIDYIPKILILDYIMLFESYIVDELSNVFNLNDWGLNNILKEIFDISRDNFSLFKKFKSNNGLESDPPDSANDLMDVFKYQYIIFTMDSDNIYKVTFNSFNIISTVKLDNYNTLILSLNTSGIVVDDTLKIDGLNLSNNIDIFTNLDYSASYNQTFMGYGSMNLPLSLNSNDNQFNSSICGLINLSINENCISLNMKNLSLLINNPLTSNCNPFSFSDKLPSSINMDEKEFNSEIFGLIEFKILL